MMFSEAIYAVNCLIYLFTSFSNRSRNTDNKQIITKNT